MTHNDLHRLAVRFCDEDASTRDVSLDGAMEYRLFLSRFLVYVQQVNEGKVVQLDSRKESSSARERE